MRYSRAILTLLGGALPPNVHRSPRFLLLAVFAALALALAGELVQGARTRAGVTAELRRARAWSDSLVAATRERTDPAEIGAADAIALGYLERLRLGLGSPFRLADFALHDPRLGDSTRRRVARAIVARTLAGDAYETDAATLDHVGSATHAVLPGSGRRHRALVDSAVAGPEHPRGGELAVRLAYALAVAEGSAGRFATVLASRTAALARDRVLAMRDARALVAAAKADRSDPLLLLPAWRAARRFEVERPTLAPIPDVEEARAIRDAIAMLPALREIAADTVGAQPGTAAPPLLGPGAARRLADLLSVADAPPQSPVIVAVDGYRESLASASARAPSRRARARFATRARSEESLAAERALAAWGGGYTGGAEPSLAVLAAAVALRAYAQEEVWFAGFPAPTPEELRSRLGLRAVVFDPGVPLAWRAYASRMLVSAVADLHRVFPTLGVQGLTVQFALRPGAGSLALHNPTTRTVHLPVTTSAGTIAHELAHDLDWQAARASDGRAGDYRTDRAVRERREGLAATVRALSATPLVPPASDRRQQSAARRPAEVFARSADWYVAAVLASEGRSNGYLTSVQDEVIAGYTAVMPPDAAGDRAAALVELLGGMTWLPPTARDEFLARWGPARTPTTLDIARRALDAPLRDLRVSLSGSTAFESPFGVRSLGMSSFGMAPTGIWPSPSAGRCAASPLEDADSPRATTRRALLDAVADARARGLVRLAVRRWGARPDAPPSIRALRGDVPFSRTLAEETIARVRDSVAEKLC